MTPPLGRRAPLRPGPAPRLHPLVSLRDESFGALAYHYGERRLVFLKSPALVAVLGTSIAHQSARAAVAAHVAPTEVDAYLAALARLFDSGVLDGPDASLRDRFELGLDAPICLTWELTWACNLACVHCLSSSGRATPTSCAPPRPSR